MKRNKTCHKTNEIVEKLSTTYCGILQILQPTPTTWLFVWRSRHVNLVHDMGVHTTLTVAVNIIIRWGKLHLITLVLAPVSAHWLGLSAVLIASFHGMGPHGFVNAPVLFVVIKSS